MVDSVDLGKTWEALDFFSRDYKRTSPKNGHNDPQNGYKAQESVVGSYAIEDRLCKDHPLFDKTPERALAIVLSHIKH